MKRHSPSRSSGFIDTTPTFATVPEYPTDTPPCALVERIMNRLGFPGETATDNSIPLVLVTRRAVVAYFAAGQPTFMSPGGGRKVKTRPHREAEGLRYLTLRLLLADWPDYPFGTTEFAVGCQIEDAHGAVADESGGK